MISNTPLLEARQLCRNYGRNDEVRALNGVDLSVRPGAPVGIAGESGSGKSTLLRMLLNLESPSSGDVLFNGEPVGSLTSQETKTFRSQVQTVFQDPGSSLDPRHHIWRLVTEPAWVSESLTVKQRKARAADLLGSVDLSTTYLNKHPHQLSGGERQRVAIARALSSSPKVILLDEPVTSLDISVRGYVINLLLQKARDEDVTYVVVSHDLSAIYHLTEYLYVMYEGIVVEEGPTVDVVADPQHPYTQALVAAINNPLAEPDIDYSASRADGSCPYIQRCPHSRASCAEVPSLRRTAEYRQVRCVLYPDMSDQAPGSRRQLAVNRVDQ